MPTPKPATMVSTDDEIRLQEGSRRYVSRGGVKLEAALRAFGVDVGGKRCLDVGASTGGFTDCLLQHGAAQVTALDVGYGQLAWPLRTNERVTAMERTNIRSVSPGQLDAPFDLIAVDVSFISLRTIADDLASLGHDGTDYVLLIKPQFEVGKSQVGRGGLVRDESLWARVIDEVIAAFVDVGLGALDLIRSPIMGAKGNVEFLLLVRPGEATVSKADIDGVVRA